MSFQPTQTGRCKFGLVWSSLRFKHCYLFHSINLCLGISPSVRGGQYSSARCPSQPKPESLTLPRSSRNCPGGYLGNPLGQVYSWSYGKGLFECLCQSIASLQRRTGNRTVTQMQHPTPCYPDPPFCFFCFLWFFGVISTPALFVQRRYLGEPSKLLNLKP